MSGRKTEKDRPGFAPMLKAAHQRKFDIIVFWALDRLTREGTRATLNYLQRLESKGVGYVSYQEQWLDSTGPFKDVMISMFATLAKQERARISERTIAGLRVARAKGKRLRVLSSLGARTRFRTWTLSTSMANYGSDAAHL
jgi:DNA invertase Pin-like site-specific DNA recombinase